MCLDPVPNPHCNDRPAGNYLARDVATGTVTVNVRDQATGVTRSVSIAAGGRVMSQR
jgi:hypothetical protein